MQSARDHPQSGHRGSGPALTGEVSEKMAAYFESLEGLG
jgi:hypothetical protein